MTYAQLVQAIKDYVENTETTFVSQIDTFIDFAELKILREADLNFARKYATATLAASDVFLSMPTDAVVVRSMHIVDANSDRTFLQQKDPSFITEFIVDRSTTGTPRYYAHYDNDTNYVAPSPSVDTTIEISYTYRPAGLSASNTTTWLGDNAPDALLYAALLEAYTFMKGEQDILQLYAMKYQEALQSLIMEENIRNRQDEYTTRSIKLILGDRK